MEKKLEGKTALITGGNSGIGLATAKLFVEQGARVAITGRDADTLAEAQRILGEDALVMQSDASQLADIEKAMAAIQQRFGGLDILFANAAIARPAPFELIDEAGFDQVMGINFKGVFFTIQKALPLLRQGSSVIVTTSISNQKAAPAFGVYAAAKAALRSLVRTLAVELADRKVRVNALSPGPVDTPGFGRWGVPDEMVQAARKQFEERSPLKRFATSDEMARIALFLASSDASYISGAELVADGGISNLL